MKKIILMAIFAIFLLGCAKAPVTEDCLGMSLEEAKEIAISSECGDNLEETSFCNENTKTFWIDLSIEKEGCSPACVVNTETKTAEINWRCTGLIVPE